MLGSRPQSPLTMYRILLFCLLFWSPLAVQAQMSYVQDELELNLEQARKDNNHEALAKAYFDLATFEAEIKNNHDKTFTYLIRSKEYYLLGKDVSGIYNCNYSIAKHYLANGMQEEAYELLQLLRKERSSLGDLAAVIDLDGLIFDYYLDQLDLESARSRLDSMIVGLGDLPDSTRSVGYRLRQIALYQLTKEYELALQQCDTCYMIARQVKKASLVAECELVKGTVLTAVGKNTSAIGHLKNSLDYYQGKPFSEKRLAGYKLMSENHESLGAHKAAYTYASKYAALQDSILNEKRIMAINNLSYKYESKNKETEIVMLEKEKAFAEKNNMQQRRALIVLGLALAGMVLGIYYLIRFYTHRISTAQIIEEQNSKINEQKINELQDKIQINSMSSMITGQEVERERIAKDLHDSIGGLLSTIKLQVEQLKSGHQKETSQAQIQRASDLLDVAVSEVRTISQDLQPGALKRLGLVPALNDLVNRYRSDTGPDITFQHYGLPDKMDQQFSLSLYRIVQEILNNAIKHAQASEIFVQLNSDESELVIHVEDDGVGFNPEKRYKSMGLENIRSRVNYLKGVLDIDSRKGEGTSFIIHVPHTKSL